MAAFALAITGGAERAGAETNDPGHTHIRIKGTARIDAHAARARARSSGELVLSGTIVDDVAHPIAGARVVVGIARATAPASAATLVGASPEACSDAAPRPVLERGDLLSLPTDDAARFCVRLTLPTDRYVIHVESQATGLVDGARLDLAVDLALDPVTLRFDPERPLLSLDEEAAMLEVVAATEDDGVTTAAVGIPLVLSNEAGTALGSTMTNASGRARFAVDPARLGPPGKGELRVSFAGSNDAGPSTQGMQIERRTHVSLVAVEAVDGVLPVGSPEDSVVVHVRAPLRCAERGRSPGAACAGSPSGTIEARVGDVIVGAAALQRGEARVVSTFDMPAANEATLVLRYVPDAPWYQVGGELALTLPMRAPSPWKKVPLALAGLAMIAWLVVARLPSRARAATDAGSGVPLPPLHPEARVDLVRASPAAQGWTGRVRDAHEGVAVGHARVVVERPTFQGVEVLGEARSDPTGAFVLPPIETRPGDVLRAEGPVHATLRRPLPPSGELEVALVFRKRALLDRLVAWARRRGRPFDSDGEPTPGHVRRVAVAEVSVARWAEAVERAAYGGGVVDEQAQGDVDRLAPPEPARRGHVQLAGDGASAQPEPPRPPPRPRPR
jgi:hypothetical protein